MSHRGHPRERGRRQSPGGRAPGEHLRGRGALLVGGVVDLVGVARVGRDLETGCFGRGGRGGRGRGGAAQGRGGAEARHEDPRERQPLFPGCEY